MLVNIGVCVLICDFSHLSSFVPFFRPHRSTTYVDVAYCYRLCSVVCWSVTLVSSAKTAAPIELPFGLRTWVGPGNHVLDGGPDPTMGRGKFLGENGRPVVKYRDTLHRDVPDIRLWFRLAGYPAIFAIRFRFWIRPKYCLSLDSATG